MTGDLNMGNNKISNLKSPTNDTDAADKSYIDKTLNESHLIASSKKNEFTYLDNPDDTSSEYNVVVNAFTNFNPSPHLNKKAYSIPLQKDAGTNNYRSRMGFNLYQLPLGTYTMIFEFFPPEITNIDLSCQATSAYIHKQVQRDFSNYSKLLVQINNNSKNTPDYIYLTMHGSSLATPVQGYVIVYGIKDWSDSVNPEIYDNQIFEEMFEYNNGDMKMNTDLDMKNKKFKNVPQPTYDTDVLTKESVKIHYIKLYGSVNIDKDLSSNNIPIGFDSVYINNITLIQKNKYRGSSDKIIIVFKNTQGNIQRMNSPFNFTGSGSQITVININRHFVDEVIRVTTQNATRIPFVLSYKIVFISGILTSRCR